MRVERLETPALIVDEEILHKNVEAMKRILEGTQLALRPHYKSHKCAQLARLQIANGAKGMTCAKLSEAEDLIGVGIEDVLIANQIVDKRKIARLAHLAGDCRLTVCVDSEDNIRDIAASAREAGTTVHCLIEYDIGMERCGVTEDGEVLRLARLISSLDGVVYYGIQAYAGHVSHVVSESRRREMTDANYTRLKALIKLLSDNGYAPETVSGGSTGTAEIKAMEGLYTELQAGSYLFMDNTYRELELPFENSLFVLTTVVSTRDGLTVVDAGVKTCGTDQGMPGVVGFEARETVASEEHFQFHGLSGDHRRGDLLRLIPGHCCSTVNLHDRIYLVNGGKVVNRLEITARKCGK